MPRGEKVCYLCGGLIAAEELTREHVPSKLLFPRYLRPGLQLPARLPAHRACNESFSDDEEYFRAKVPALSEDTPAARGLLDDFLHSVGKPGSEAFIRRLEADLTDVTPSGLILPAPLLGMKYQGDRIDRVIWKVIRGLAYRHYGEVLPDKPRSGSVGHLQSEQFQKIGDLTPALALMRWVTISEDAFSYGFYSATSGTSGLTVFILRFMNSLMGYASFHTSTCACERCEAPEF